MAELQIEFRVTGDASKASAAIKERLEILPFVKTADVTIEKVSAGMGEAISLLVGTVSVLGLSTAGVAQLRALLRELAGLQRDLTGTQSLLIHVGDEKLEPAKVDDAMLEKLLEILRS